MNTNQKMLKKVKAQNINLTTLIRLIRANDTKELTMSITKTPETIFLTRITSLN